MTLHKTDISPVKESRKINLSGFPFFHLQLVLLQAMFNTLHAIGFLVPLSSTAHLC